MSTADLPPAPVPGAPWHERLHRALMPDYNARAAAYWYLVVLLGGATLALCVAAVAAQPAGARIRIAIGVAVAMLAALFPVRIPRSKHSLAAGETFIFLLLLLQGPAAAALAAAGEAGLGAFRTSGRWTSRIASPAMAALAMFASGSLLTALLDALQAFDLTNGGLLIVASIVFSLAYFVLNTLLVTALPRLKRNERLRVDDLVGVFGWLGIVYSGSAGVAALLYLAFRQSGHGVLLAAVPIIGLLLMTLHYFFRQQEANEAMRRASAEAAAREAEVAKRHMEELHRIAFQDALTGLPNRRSFNDHLLTAIGTARSDPGRLFAAMFVDLDRFKLINDSLGHSAGDDFLCQVARRITDTLRPGDIVARLGGDEFAILAGGLDQAQDAIALADRLIAALRCPFKLGATELAVSASIGITFSSVGYDSPDEVLRDADIAMYKAKEGGKGRYAVFDGSLHADVARRLQFEAELRSAIGNGGLAVAYQPLFNLRSGKLVGFEALARWVHPQLGPVAPDVFIPIAEESGLIVALTDLVLERACHQLRQWQLKDPRFADLHMHVNISARDLEHDELVGRVTRAVLHARLQPQCLTLELTETILMERIERALPMLSKLRDLGIGLSVDDFGTGYSSLSHLSRVPVDTLKVDRSFVRRLRPGSSEEKVVRAIVHLGASLDKATVAEGIEDAGQLALLRQMGCARGQGFHLGRPQPPEAIDSLLGDLIAEPDGKGRAARFEPSVLLH